MKVKVGKTVSSMAMCKGEWLLRITCAKHLCYYLEKIFIPWCSIKSSHIATLNTVVLGA
jgi:hypothetical protein